MEKYAVLTSSESKYCKICGEKLQQKGNVLECPKHGTEPTEETK